MESKYIPTEMTCGRGGDFEDSFFEVFFICENVGVTK